MKLFMRGDHVEKILAAEPGFAALYYYRDDGDLKPAFEPIVAWAYDHSDSRWYGMVIDQRTGALMQASRLRKFKGLTFLAPSPYNVAEAGKWTENWDKDLEEVFHVKLQEADSQ